MIFLPTSVIARSSRRLIPTTIILVCSVSLAFSQQPTTPPRTTTADEGISVPIATSPVSTNPVARSTGPSVSLLPARQLAEGILITIPPDQNAQDTAIGPMSLDFVGKNPDLEWTGAAFPQSQPNFASRSETLLEMGREVTLRHAIWGLEFAFKPIRTIEADVPQSSGKMQRKLVWYLVFRVRYLGGDLLPNISPDPAGVEIPDSPKPVVFKSVRFLPRFTLLDTQSKTEKDSQVLTTVIPKIAARERIGKPLMDTFQISKSEILPSLGDDDKPLWGIATWTDIDPTVDFLTVQVKGLTNAYQVKVDTSGKSIYRRKTLQLHFWRPGDSLSQAEDRVRLGVPAFLDSAEQQYVLKQFGLEKRLDYQWIYR